MKNSNETTGIEPATFRFVAQHLNPTHTHTHTHIYISLGKTEQDHFGARGVNPPIILKCIYRNEV